MFLKRNLIFILLIALVSIRFLTSQTVYKDGVKVKITARVLSDPVRHPNSQAFKIAGLRVYLPPVPEISYGDRISLEGIPEKGILKKAKLTNISGNSTVLAGFRNRIISFYQEVLPEPLAGLLAGIVLGSKGALTPEFYNQTKTTGVAHVVVASGTNITFLVSFLTATLSLFLSRKKTIPFVILSILLYLLISGFEAPLIRASFMSFFIFLGQEGGRPVNTWRVFFLSALIMLVIKPVWISDIGFILSFVSTSSLLMFEKGIRLRLKFMPEFLKEGLSTSVAAQIGVAPVIFITFGQFNILSPVINALILWTIPLIMILGSLGGVLGLVIPVAGKVILWLCYPLLWWFSEIVSIFQVPLSI